MKRAEILRAAEQCVCSDRNRQYGEPEDNFKIIAMLWSVYLCARGMEAPLRAQDVGLMMALFKIARAATGGWKDDNFIDLAGYAACAAEIASKSGSGEKSAKGDVESQSAVQRKKTVKYELADSAPASGWRDSVHMSREPDGSYLVKVGCAIHPAADLAAAMKIIDDYAHGVMESTGWHAQQK